MRNLQECQAEVFRRSEKRIQERRKVRNHILAVCIPVCLVITVWSSTMLPALFPGNRKNMPTEEKTEFADDVVGSAAGSDAAFVRVQVVSAGAAAQTAIIKEDAAEVARIYDAVQAAFARAGEGDQESVQEESADDTQEPTEEFPRGGTATMSAGYKLIFSTGNGKQTVYSLTGSTLIHEATGQQTILPTDRRSELLHMLGLTITWEEGPK